MTFIEQTLSEALNRAKEENDALKSKIFIMEQSVIKKDNIIMHFKKKNEDKESEYECEGELYILNPTKAIVQINDELIMYKQIYDSLISHIKEIRESLFKTDLINNELQKENSKLRIQYKYHMVTATREKETLINAFQHERVSSNNLQFTDNGLKSNISQTKSNTHKTDFIARDLQIYKNFQLNHIDQTKFENEEFMEILKSNNLNQIEFEKLSKSKSCSRLTEVIEMLYSLLKDKNMSLNLLKEEVDKLITKNFQLNKDNMVLFQQNIEFKKQLANDKSSASKNKSNYPDSLINNTSQITTNHNHNITNAISTYHKFIKLEEKNATEIYTSSFEREHSSEHDSIVYMKNIREYSNDINENTTNASKDKKVLESHNKESHNNNKNMMTMESITSSEFREGFKDVNSFISTIRDNKCEDESVNANVEEKESDLNVAKIKSSSV